MSDKKELKVSMEVTFSDFKRTSMRIVLSSHMLEAHITDETILINEQVIFEDDGLFVGILTSIETNTPKIFCSGMLDATEPKSQKWVKYKMEKKTPGIFTHYFVFDFEEIKKINDKEIINKKEKEMEKLIDDFF